MPITDRVEDLPGRPCSVAAALDVVGDRWSLLAVREVHLGNHRFSDIARNTGAPRDRLAARLKSLVEAGVLERRLYQTAPARHDYHLSDAGRDLIPILQALLTWGDRWAAADPPLTILHHDHPLQMRPVCDECGETVRRRDLTWVSNRPNWDRAGPIGV